MPAEPIHEVDEALLPTGVALDDDYVYWTALNRRTHDWDVRRAPRRGGALDAFGNRLRRAWNDRCRQDEHLLDRRTRRSDKGELAIASLRWRRSQQLQGFPKEGLDVERRVFAM